MAARLLFSGEHTEPSGPLVDGNYQLTIDGDGITDSNGLSVDVDGDGVPGGVLVIGDEEEENFYRLFGDADSNRQVNFFDFIGFRQTYSLMTGDAIFDESFDSNADGVISFFTSSRFARTTERFYHSTNSR